MAEAEEEQSRLGTKEYWDEAYQTENRNFDEFGDEGEVWFGNRWEKNVLNWLRKQDSVLKTDKISDLGCGNGSMLKALIEAGYSNVFGCDYSEDAIELSRKVAGPVPTLKVADILARDFPQMSELSGTSVAVDKGTWDAISLRKDRLEALKAYKENVGKILKGEGSDGRLLLISCNFTEEELRIEFEGWAVVEVITNTPTFTFGGQKGNTVTGAVLRKLE